MTDYDAHRQLTVSRPRLELLNERPPLVVPQPPQGDPAKPDTWAMV